MLLHIARVIFVLLEVLILFNLLIVVHELGHFLAARWRGLYVEKFGVWFGKPLWKRKINGVQYSLGSLPFGGFVALPQLAPMDIIEGKADVDRARLPKISALDKIIVAIAGPFFSLLLAICFAAIVWAVGHPVGEADSTTVIGYVMPDSPAQKAGLLPGDKILSVDGKPVRRFLGMNDSVSWDVVRSEGDKIAVKFQRDGKVQTVWVEPYKAETRGWRRKSIRQLLVYPAETPIIAKVEPNTPAAAAGLRAGDIIRGFDQTPIYNPIALLEYISKHPKDELVLHVERGGAKLDIPVKPTPLPTGDQMKPRIGIEWDTAGIVSIQHPSPIEQVYNSVTSTLKTIGAVASPKSDVKLQHLSGPVGIWNIYVRLFEAEGGWKLALWFSVILNVNLAILNMLPIPVLDGGHIVLALIESVRRKPVNMRILEVVQTSCAVVIIGYMLYITFFDVQDLPFVRKKLDQLEAQSPAKNSQTP
ncbi:MAG: RIP metalloprotease RseP [Verrucomicrobia bacterium]|nr:MAG: RIP metalloprotease RseP [Verrucomicrobiota bacterium]PYK24846.1 MAG: RIP metalloprotease RseP [Verrucomicrobiota bacterium]PYK50721.1 MAG: RIP metalloprotease RseP [Verrucomicrobiota bacterium]